MSKEQIVANPRGTLFVCCAISFLVALAAAFPAGAQSGSPSFWFAGAPLLFERAIPLDGDIAVSTSDSGLVRFLAKLGATIAYQPQRREVILTAADRRTVTFTIGDAQYGTRSLTARARFAPFVDRGSAIVGLYAIAHALYVEPVTDGSEIVLQPQIGALDVRTEGGRTLVDIRGATTLSYVRRLETQGHLELTFPGVATMLTGGQRVGALESVTIASSGPRKNPTTTIAFNTARSSSHTFLTADSPAEVSLLFAAPGAFTPLPAAPTASPMIASTPSPQLPSPSSTGAVVTQITLQPGVDGLTIHVTVSKNATYQWHRLADLRWYIDIEDASLPEAGREERPALGNVESVRIRQIGLLDAPTVRIALTLRSEDRVDVLPTADGLAVVATNVPSLTAARTGSGTLGGGAVAVTTSTAGAAPAATAPSPVPAMPSLPALSVPAGGARTIVLDPGHGGADTGTAHNGLVEKNITIDIARRLRTLLVAQGWTVLMTWDSDVDPVSPDTLAAMRTDGKPDPVDRAYLQTRSDVANRANARLFISIHANYSDDPSVNGTTFYWYKPQDQVLAKTLESTVISVARTNDRGAQRQNLYVVRHATMPAALIETAFVSNLHDAALLASSAFLQSIAQGIADGVKAYTSTFPLQESRLP